MTLYTSNFARNGNHPQAVSIARSTPKFFTGRECKLLAPPWDLVKRYKDGVIDWAQYTVEYNAMLERLGERKATMFLKDGDVLLCYESPSDNCHRHLLAEYLKKHGHTVLELGVETNG